MVAHTDFNKLQQKIFEHFSKLFRHFSKLDISVSYLNISVSYLNKLWPFVTDLVTETQRYQYRHQSQQKNL